MNRQPFVVSRMCSHFAVLTWFALPLQAADAFDDYIRRSEPLAPAQELAAFHVPPGFEVQLVAAEPDIGKPMNMAFDARGRLWIAQSREYPYAAPSDKPGRDVIKVLSDFDEHGRARKISTFAEGLNIPIGLCPYKEGVIAFSIPNIYYFEDTDGDGRADKQELILGRFGYDRDTHGLTSSFRHGYDGWIYADHGYNNNTTLKAKDGSSITMNSGNTYRFRPDGARVEQYTWGQVNPFGLMFDPLGDLWSADCHSSPVYQLLRGVYYPSFGKPDDGLGFGPGVCAHTHGSTAIAGMVFYAAQEFPPEFRGNTFVGNVMTCRINRDSLIEHGSTRIAREQPDLLASDDPWFRPVDLQLGPDGAIYVADFYNRIIGHYEVPLDHPGRDRERGRIWRIAYRGTPLKLALPDSAAGLVNELGSSNLARRMLAMNNLVDRFGPAALEPVRAMMSDAKSSAPQRIHGLWVLHRLHGLAGPMLLNAARDPDRGVRVHAMRVLSETGAWTAEQTALALGGLRDSDPYVQRAAADAAGQHPADELIRPLLELYQRALTTEDSQLQHVLRMSLRNQFIVADNLTRLSGSQLSESESRAVAEVSLGLKSAEAGKFLIRHVRKYPEPPERLNRFVRHAAHYAPEAEMSELGAFARERFASDLDFQLALFKALQEGAGARGGSLPPATREWGAELAENLLLSVNPGALDWHNEPVPGRDPTNPWILQKRASSDGGQEAEFVCSLAPDGERFTGVLRSRAFTIPPKLGFFLAGHDGPPDKPPQKKNVFRLRAAGNGEILASTSPPRNDIAQPFAWDLAAHAGTQGYLELVDDDTGSGYAWLALGRLDPLVVALPTVPPRNIDERQVAAAGLARSLNLSSIEPRLRQLLADPAANPGTRAAAANALARLNAAANRPSFSNLLCQASTPALLRDKLAAVLGELKSPAARAALLEALRTAPADLQTQIALALASSPEGAEALLRAVGDGQASPRLLQQRNVLDRLAASTVPNLAQRLQTLTANLPPASAVRQQLLDARRATFQAAQTSPAKGAALFKQHCAICHSLDGEGTVIGPQLDGVGGRGPDRLLEDILDPNRNVDRAFRSTLLVLGDGDVQSGLMRREDGETLVLAQSTGKEISVPKKDVKERRESETSLMPDNFGDVLPLADLNDLIAFLISKNQKPRP